MGNILKKKSSNTILTTWFFKTRIITELKNLLGVGVNKIQIVSGFEIVLETAITNLYPIIHFLNKHTFCQSESLMDIVCYDTLGKTHRFCLIYNLLSVHFNCRIRIASRFPELSDVLSVMGLFKAANWLEREVFDFFGIFFLGNKDLRRILTDYGFKGFPLRKDFPLTGYIDVYYDDNQKRVCYRNLEVSQEYRTFNFVTKWKSI